MPSSPERCPCGSGAGYAACCRPFHTGDATPPTAERLMRARYSAFAVGDLDFVSSTWHSTGRPIALRDDPAQVWTGLEVLDRTGGSLFDRVGTVAFRAHYTRERAAGVIAEVSRFVREDGRWWYVGPEPDTDAGAPR